MMGIQGMMMSKTFLGGRRSRKLEILEDSKLGMACPNEEDNK